MLFSLLQDSVRPAFESFATRLDKAGHRYKIQETYRTQEVQDAYFAQGRESLDSINELRKVAKLHLIGEAESKRIITSARYSVHQDRRAADIVPVLANGMIPWDYGKYKALWLEFGTLGMECGLEWGGHTVWTPLLSCGLGWDPPHYQKVIKGA